MIEVVKSFGDAPELQVQMVKAILSQMKKDNLDVRSFNFYQLGEFVALVSKCVPEDLPVFKKYLNATISQDFFDKQTLEKGFFSYFNILHNLALQGDYLEGPAFNKFIVLLSDKMKKRNSNFIQQHLISLTWTLIHKQTLAPDMRSPVIPNLITILYNYERKQQGLANLELLQLY